MTARQIQGIAPISLDPSPAFTGASVGAITSTTTISCSGYREQPNNPSYHPINTNANEPKPIITPVVLGLKSEMTKFEAREKLEREIA